MSRIDVRTFEQSLDSLAYSMSDIRDHLERLAELLERKPTGPTMGILEANIIAGAIREGAAAAKPSAPIGLLADAFVLLELCEKIFDGAPKLVEPGSFADALKTATESLRASFRLHEVERSR